MEIWRKIKGYDIYYVSSEGRVKSTNYKNTGTEQILKTQINRYGYEQIRLKNENDRKSFTIHKLVAIAFPEICGEWFEGCEVDHINTKKTDNRAINLRAVTAEQNRNNPLTIEHSKKQHPKQEILQYTLKGEFIREWSSVREAASFYDKEPRLFYPCLTGKKNSCLGYLFEYKDESRRPIRCTKPNKERVIHNRKPLKPVIAIRISDGVEEYYESSKMASEKLNYSQGTIVDAITNSKIRCKRIWKYAA